jgi:hypothetical protein
LFLQLFDGPPFLGQTHPTELNRLPNELIDLAGAKEISHFLG